MEWVVPEEPLHENRLPPERFRLALFVSFALHGVLIALFFAIGSSKIPSSVNESGIVQINFVPAELFRPELIPEPITPINEAPLEALTNTLEPEFDIPPISEPLPAVENTPQIATPLETPVSVEVPEIAESPTTPTNSEQVPVVAPDRVAIRQIVKSLGDQQTGENWRFDCTQSQKNNELIKCDEETSGIVNVQALDSRRYFLIAQPDNSARRAQAFIWDNSSTLRSNLGSVSLENITIGQLLEDMEASISVYSNTGNVPVQRLTDQIYANDPAYQQMKRVMGVQ